ncbi:MAG TPA: hypothetical protein VMB91_13800 [Solirubrobacteraceae bacterium]|nr:hypothetical protein [Solirubrobacteraceae bacterium]
MVALGAAVALAGCASHKVATPGEAKLENEDLAAVTADLRAAAPQVEAEVAAAKAAWPAILAGVRGRPTASTRAKVAIAAERAAQVPLPSLLGEEGSAQLTGPAFSLAGQFRSFRTLGARSWQLLDSSLEEIDHGSPAEARFARRNLPLYIESIYDAHFALGGLGKKLSDAFKKLGGEGKIGGSLSPAELQRLAETYSQERNDLSPKERVKLGS